MIKNMGSVDRLFRVVIAIVLAILFYKDIIAGVWGIVALVVAGVFVLTSLMSSCPLYLPFGIRTSRLKKTTK
ncbi:YgaP family membrane protein [Spirosoma pollinicola]|uniref:DUF2892 domain-containing protein n=1 Tax=Spirosoma pollinicola TaxID=2057025 RepID=A0A2K8ZBQ6_9BACT|nr:DUF2892 domain-containing protein [Spirosoma pollinicola]AUD07295.1 DUF2892 domain-containing protein [Spirosoma pollinicola]